MAFLLSFYLISVSLVQKNGSYNCEKIAKRVWYCIYWYFTFRTKDGFWGHNINKKKSYLNFLDKHLLGLKLCYVSPTLYANFQTPETWLQWLSALISFCHQLNVGYKVFFEQKIFNDAMPSSAGEQIARSLAFLVFLSPIFQTQSSLCFSYTVPTLFRVVSRTIFSISSTALVFFTAKDQKEHRFENFYDIVFGRRIQTKTFICFWLLFAELEVSLLWW